MNCDQFAALTGMRCEPLPMRDGSQAVALVTPFSFFDGDGLEVYAASAGQQVHFFDDGLTLHWLRGLGVKLGDDRRRWVALRNAAEPYGVTLSDDGSFEALAPVTQPALGFAKMISALLAVDVWAREHVGLPTDAHWLAEEAALYLRAWKPTAILSTSPEPIIGLSNRPHTFHFELDGELVDAIAPHARTTGAELRKLVDVRSRSTNRDLEIRVILDDRRDEAMAAQEGAILGNFAHVWTMTKLIKATGATTRARQ